MYMKKIKRKCSIKGCKNNDSFMFSKSAEMGSSIIICKDCLEQAYNLAKDYKEPEKPTVNAAPPPMFFGDRLKQMAKETPVEPVPAKAEKAAENTENSFVCSRCGKEFKTEQGYKKHCSVCTGAAEK